MNHTDAHARQPTESTPDKPGSRLFQRLQIISIPAIILITTVAVFGLRSILQNFVIAEARIATVRFADAMTDYELRSLIEHAAIAETPLEIPIESIPRIDRQIHAVLAPFGIVKVKIYDIDTEIIYSTDSTIIGVHDSNNIELAQALDGAVAIQYGSKENLWDLKGEQYVDVEIVETYVPLRTEAGDVVGCFEAYKDVTADLVIANQTTLQAGAILAITVLCIFVALMILIRRTTIAIDTTLSALSKSEDKYILLNAELQSTVKELRRSNRELKDFAHIIAHDLKAPLRGIGTLAEWLESDYREKFDDLGREKIQLLRNRAVKMSNLVDDILRYSEIGRRHQPGRRIDLSTLLTQIVSNIDRPDHIEITIDNNLPVIVCERTRIVQIFENLIRNAVAYIDKPRGKIHVSCLDDGSTWRFAVEDNGPGIEKKHFKRIFKIFQTLSPAEDSKSTGVGLAMVKKIVETYGGSIWVESEINKSTTFFFTIPKTEVQIKDVQL